MERFFLVSPIERVDVRDGTATHDNTWTMSGYAAVFNQETTAFDDGFDRMTVQIDPEAFTNVLANQNMSAPEGAVHFNIGHDMNTAVAATDVPPGRPGSLELSRDGYGLRFLARVPKDDPDGVRLASKMRSGVIRQASFAFTVPHDGNEYKTFETDTSYEVNRRITEIQTLYDVCACPQGLFSQTVSGLQQYAKHLGQPDVSGGRPRQPAPGGAIDITHDGSVDSNEPYFVRADEALELVRHASMYGGSLRR